MEQTTSEVAQELLAPGVAIGVLIAALKMALPQIPGRVLPAVAIVLGIGAAVLADPDADVLTILLLGITIGSSASGIRSWVRSEPVLDGAARRLPGGAPDD